MACNITIDGKVYTEAQFKKLLKDGLLFDTLQRGLVTLPIETAEQVVAPEKPLKRFRGNFPRTKEDIVTAMKNIFGLDNEKAKASAEIIDRMANSWAARNGKTKEEFYETITFVKPEGAKTPEVTPNLLFAGLKEFEFVDMMEFEDDPNRSNYIVNRDGKEVGIVEINKNQFGEYYVSWIKRTGGIKGDGTRIIRTTMQNLINKGLPVGIDTAITADGFAAMSRLAKEGFLIQVGEEIAEPNQRSLKPSIYETPPFILNPEVQANDAKILFQKSPSQVIAAVIKGFELERFAPGFGMSFKSKNQKASPALASKINLWLQQNNMSGVKFIYEKNYEAIMAIPVNNPNLLFQKSPSSDAKLNNFFGVIKPELDKLALKWAEVFNKQRALITIDDTNDSTEVSNRKEYNLLEKEIYKIGKLISDLYGFSPQGIDENNQVRFLGYDKTTSEFTSEYISNSDEITIFGKEILGETPRLIVDKNLNYRTENIPGNLLFQGFENAKYISNTVRNKILQTEPSKILYYLDEYSDESEDGKFFAELADTVREIQKLKPNKDISEKDIAAEQFRIPLDLILALTQNITNSNRELVFRLLENIYGISRNNVELFNIELKEKGLFELFKTFTTDKVGWRATDNGIELINRFAGKLNGNEFDDYEVSILGDLQLISRVYKEKDLLDLINGLKFDAKNLDETKFNSLAEFYDEVFKIEDRVKTLEKLVEKVKKEKPIYTGMRTESGKFLFPMFEDTRSEIAGELLNNPSILNQYVQAAILLGQDGLDIIYALTNPNVSSPLHEMAHKWERELTEEERNTTLAFAAENGVDITNGWTREVSEAFARGFEKYLAEGIAPSAALDKLFKQFAKWLSDIYKGIVGSEIDLKLNDDMRKVYAAMLGENFETVIKEEVAAEVSTPVESTQTSISLFPQLSQPSGILGTDLSDTTAFNNGRNLVENLFASSEEGKQELLKIIDDLYNGMTRAEISLKYDLDESQVSQIRTYLGIPSRSTPSINGVVAGSVEEVAEAKELFQKWKNYIDSVKSGTPIQESQEENLENEIEDSTDWTSPLTESTENKETKIEAIVAAYENKSFDEAIKNGQLTMEEAEQILLSAGLPENAIDKIMFRLSEPEATYNVKGLLTMKVNAIFQQVAEYFVDNGMINEAINNDVINIVEAKELIDKINLDSKAFQELKDKVNYLYEAKLKEQKDNDENNRIKRGGFSVGDSVNFRGTKYIILDEEFTGKNVFKGFVLIDPRNNKGGKASADQLKEWTSEMEKEWAAENRIAELKEQLGENKKKEVIEDSLEKKQDKDHSNLSYVPFNDVKGKGVSAQAYAAILNMSKKFSAMFPTMSIEMTYLDNEFKGKVSGTKVIINLKYATQDTPVHELLHPFITVLKLRNPKLYNRLLAEFKSNEATFNVFMEDVLANPAYASETREAQEEEAFIEYLGNVIAGLYDSKGNFVEPVVFITKKGKGQKSTKKEVQDEFADEDAMMMNLDLGLDETEDIFEEEEDIAEDNRTQEYYEELGYRVQGEVESTVDGKGRKYTKIKMIHPRISEITSNYMKSFYNWFLDLLKTFSGMNKKDRKGGAKAVQFSEWNLAVYDPVKDEVKFFKPAKSRAERIEKEDVLDEEGNVIGQKTIKKGRRDVPSLTISTGVLMEQLSDRGASQSEISRIMDEINSHRNEDFDLEISLENSYVPGKRVAETATQASDVSFFGTDRIPLDVKDLPANMTINDLASLFAVSGDRLSFDFTENVDALTELEAYQYTVNQAAKDLITKTEKRVKLLAATEGRLGLESSATIKAEAFAIKELLNKYKDVQFIEAYVRQGISALADAAKIIKYVKESINDGEAADEAMNQTLNRDLREAQALMAFYDNVAGLIEKNQELFEQEDLDYFNMIMTRATSRRKDINNIMVDLITEWLYPTIKGSQKGVAEKDAMSKEDFKKNVRAATSDVDFLGYWMQAPVNSKDPLMAALAIKIKDDLNKSYKEEENTLQTIRVLYDNFLKRTGLANSAKAVEDYYKANFLRKAKVWELISIEKDGTKKYGYVDRWAFHEEYLADVHAEQRRQEIERLKKQLGEPNNYEERLAFNNRLTAWDNANPLQSPRFKNPAFERLKNDEYYMFLYNTYKKSNDKYGERRLSYGIIPQAYNAPNTLERIKQVGGYVNEVIKGDKSVGDKLKDLAVNSANAVFDKDSFEKIQALNLDGSYHMSVKSPFTHLLDEQYLSFKLNEAVYGFSTAANAYNTLRSNQANVENLKLLINGNAKLGIEARKVLKNQIKTKNGITSSELVFDVVEGMPPQDKEQSAKKLTAQMNAYINDVFYGVSEVNSEFNIGPVVINTNKLADNLGFGTALLNMAGNVLAGLSNITIGNVMSLGESFGGKYYKPSDWLAAQKIYMGQLLGGRFLADAIDPVKSKVTQLGIMHDAIQGEFRDKYGKNITGNVLQRYFTKDTLFIINHIAEHQIQLTGMLALMNATKVKLKDGSEINLYDAYERNEKGFYKLREDAIWSDKQQQEFIRTLHGISRDLNGNYAAYDKAMLQRYALGKLVLQYRKYLYTAWRTRFGRKRYDYERGTTAEGYYNAFGKALWNDIKQFNLVSAARTLVDPTLNSSTLTEEQKYAIRKTRYDIVLVTGLTMLATMLATLEVDTGDDDEDKYLIQLALLWSLRLRSDISSYSITLPQEVHKMITNPSASFNTIAKFADFGGQLFNDISNGQFETYERRTGTNEAGDLKVVGKFEKLLPVYRQWLRLQDPEDQLRYYDLINKNVKPSE